MYSPDSAPTSTPPFESHLASREAWQTEITGRRHIGAVALSNLQEPLTVKNLEDEAKAYDALTNLILAGSASEQEAADMIEHIEGIEKAALGDRPVMAGNPFLDENIGNIGPLIDPRPIVMADPKVQEIVNNRDLSKSHQGLHEAWPKFRETFVRGIKKGIEQGYIPTKVADRLESALNKTSVRVTDSAVLDTYDHQMSAYYRNDHDEIGIRHNIEEIGGKYQHSLAHEFTHKVSGGTFKSPEDDSTEYNRPRVGFSTEIKPEVLNRTGLNEAVTHHVTLGILTGDFETFDPDERQDGNKTYYDYRKVLATFINRSRGLIDVKTITNGFFEDTGPEGSTEARRKLIREVNQAYGPRALTKLDKLLNLTDSLSTDRIDEIILSRIHPPEIDEQGNINARGRIDTENLPTFYDLFETKETSSGNVK